MTATNETVTVGEGRIIKQGERVAILCFGPLLHQAVEAAHASNASVIDMRFVKPIDEKLILQLCQTHQAFITLEDNAIMGGAGSGVNEFLLAQQQPHKVVNLGIPDEYVQHASQNQQWAQMGLDKAGIDRAITKLSN